jgi:hypothetical protein
MKDGEHIRTVRTNPNHATIKVTDKDTAYFVHFDRVTHDLIEVFEYKKIYTPSAGPMSVRTKIIVDLAKSRIGVPREETNQPQETTT